MAVIGENIFVVGEQVSDAGNIQGVFMSTSVSSGDLSDCDNDISCLVTSISNYDDLETLDSVDVSLSFPSSFPARIDIREKCSSEGRRADFKHSKYFPKSFLTNCVL